MKRSQSESVDVLIVLMSLVAEGTPQLALQLAPFTLGEETYGFALKATEPLRTKLDVSILRMRRIGQVKAITDEHLN